MTRIRSTILGLAAIAVLAVMPSICAQSSSAAQVQPNQLEVPANSQNSPILEAVKLKNWKQVIELAQNQISINPADASAFYWQGIGHLQLHDSLSATQSLRAAEKLGMDTALLHVALGLAYYDLNQFFLFEQQMQKAALLDPSDFKPHYYLGLYRLEIQSDAGQALKAFTTAAQLQPDDWKSIYQKGNCLEILGQPTQAAEVYRKAIDIVEANGQPFGWPYQGMARLLLESKPADALSYARKAIELQPEEYSNHLLLARVYEHLGQLRDAINEARAASEKNPTDSASRYELFTLYKQVGDRAAAQAELANFLKVKATYGAN